MVSINQSLWLPQHWTDASPCTVSTPAWLLWVHVQGAMHGVSCWSWSMLPRFAASPLINSPVIFMLYCLRPARPFSKFGFFSNGLPWRRAIQLQEFSRQGRNLQ